MALISEDGTGVVGARSYASLAEIEAHWTALQHDPLAAVWSGETNVRKEGAAIEASAYLDATYGMHYRGIRRTSGQGLLWPRSDAMDGAGYPLPDRPAELVRATAELAVRAISGRLRPDQAEGQVITGKTEKVGPLEDSTDYSDKARLSARYGVVDGIMAPLLEDNRGWAWR